MLHVCCNTPAASWVVSLCGVTLPPGMESPLQANAGRRRYAALRQRLMKAWGFWAHTARVGEHEEFAWTMQPFVTDIACTPRVIFRWKGADRHVLRDWKSSAVFFLPGAILVPVRSLRPTFEISTPSSPKLLTSAVCTVMTILTSVIGTWIWSELITLWLFKGHDVVHWGGKIWKKKSCRRWGYCIGNDMHGHCLASIRLDSRQPLVR